LQKTFHFKVHTRDPSTMVAGSPSKTNRKTVAP